MKPTCATCKNYESKTETCRAAPPQVHLNKLTVRNWSEGTGANYGPYTYEGYWPKIKATDWCAHWLAGEHVDSTEPAAKPEKPDPVTD